MEKLVLIIDDDADIRDDVKWAVGKKIPSASTIEASNKTDALELIRRFRDKIFAVVCDGNLGDGELFAGLDILDEAKSNGINNLIFFSVSAHRVPEERRQEDIHYTDSFEEVLSLLEGMNNAQ
ncbi:MAG: hypothetical protein US89_C0001G0051 [Candidatus Peregrinibacteria bacterium GW2011_GWF2_38_29]|nr:MAG: hypothetical protein US89_C0001G0051 [Candidatus Peregrinibacteria bacterium GW2011_GWF2_38_29]HBB03086.1 hypothetical protein [Candidatus Peregrinibacteria bacterium]